MTVVLPEPIECDSRITMEDKDAGNVSLDSLFIMIFCYIVGVGVGT